MSKIDARILVVDDDGDVLQAARIFLKQHLKEVDTETDPSRIPDLLASRDYSVILLDMNFSSDVSSGREGFHWLEQILRLDPSAVVILITAYGDVEMAVRAIKEGATDFVLKPWQNEKLLATISAGLDLKRLRSQVASLKTREKMLSDDIDRKFSDIVAASSAMEDVFTTIEKISGTDANVLILGENGTGKELVAREIHRQSKRAKDVFISVDMGAITESLFESELFGHKKGAFTDAREDRAGRFEIASGGTLFLDEIGNLPLPLQAKLLSVLQNRQVMRIGSNTSIPIDIRLICATNLPIHSMVDESRFRQDLLYRINTVEIRIPPLRERGEDIHLLVEHFLEIFCRKYGKNKIRVQASALKRLEKYDWPGNVRELQHAVERAVIMGDAASLGPGDFFLASRGARSKSSAFDNCNLEEVEREVIRNAMIKHDGNVSRAAKELGLTRTSLYRRMRKHDL